MMRIVIAVFLLAGSVLGQPANKSAQMHRHKKYDTTDVRPNVHSKKATIDVDSTSFTVYAWGEECYLKVDMLGALMPFADTTFVDTVNGAPRVTIGSDAFQYETMINAGGDFEWNAVLYERPAGNSVTCNIEAQGLRFSYQGELTAEEIADGAVRPDSIVGSYAVYHATMQHDYQYADGSAAEYGTGKLMHISRPKAWDAGGDTIYVDMNIDTVAWTLKLTIPNQWKNQATYPVTIDPTFGITSIGGTNIELGIYAIGFNSAFQLYTASTGDVVTTMHVYTNTPNQNDRSMSLYDTATSNGTPNNQMFTPVAITSGSQGWHTGSVSWALANNQEYTIVCGGAGSHSYVYDANASNILSRDNTEDPLQDPFTQSSTRTYEVSMYATFTEAGAGTPFINLLHGPIGAGQRHGPSDTTRIHGSE